MGFRRSSVQIRAPRPTRIRERIRLNGRILALGYYLLAVAAHRVPRMALNAAERRQESPGLRAILGFKRSPQTAHYSAATGLRLDQDLLTFVQETHRGNVTGAR
jgi:hypothetical protein